MPRLPVCVLGTEEVDGLGSFVRDSDDAVDQVGIRSEVIEKFSDTRAIGDGGQFVPNSPSCWKSGRRTLNC